jgi:hypothetical protein
LQEKSCNPFLVYISITPQDFQQVA